MSWKPGRHKEVIGQELPFTGTLASTGMNFQVNDGGMPCFNFGVGGPYGNTHKQDESVSIDELADLTKITALRYLRKLGSSTGDLYGISECKPDPGGGRPNPTVCPAHAGSDFPQPE
jgi:hypothetical protein